MLEKEAALRSVTIKSDARNRSLGWLLIGATGIGFQVLHFIEHLAQLGYWALHPAHAPWLTPWAEVGRDVLAAGGHPSTGSELLHLLGNVIFLLGLLGLWRSLLLSGVRPARSLRAALWLQAAHVGEHVLLTASWVLAGTAVGVSTLFGALEGSALFGYRIWWHFLINLAGTALALQGLSWAWGGTSLLQWRGRRDTYRAGRT